MTNLRQILTIAVVVVVVLVLLAIIAREVRQENSRSERRGRSRERRRPSKGGTWSGKRERSPRDSKCRSCSRSPDVRRTIHDSGVSLSSSDSCDSRSPESRNINQGPHARIPRSRSCSRSRSRSRSRSCSRERRSWHRFISRSGKQRANTGLEPGSQINVTGINADGTGSRYTVTSANNGSITLDLN